MKTTMDKMDNQELISALADGQLRGEDVARAVEAVAADARARDAWCAYHVVGEVLRTGSACTGSAPDAFLAKLQQRLRDEPVAAEARVQVVAHAGRVAANDWAWKLVAGLASVAAFGAVGWNLWGVSGGAPSQLASTGGTPAVMAVSAEAGAAPAMIRDGRLDQLLQAHRQFGGGTALGTTSGFLRNATFEGPAR